MGLYVSKLGSLVLQDVQRELYIYLLDYGWPTGEYRKICNDHFRGLARRASETGALIIDSHEGIHFANEVLSWHRIFDLPADELLPALLITKTHPSYFADRFYRLSPTERATQFDEDSYLRNKSIVISLKQACRTEGEFERLVAGIFTDLENGESLSNFRAFKHNLGQSDLLDDHKSKRLLRSVILQPNFMGVGVDLKRLVERILPK